MDIEQAFAAEIFNAEHEAAIMRKHGYETTAADQVAGAEADLWECGLPRAQIRTIADKYVTAGGEPRPISGDNVIRLRSRP